jgi:hypothetical protein
MTEPPWNMSSIAAQEHRRLLSWSLCGLSITSAAVAAVVVAAGPAQAASSPSVVGQKYSDAKSALSGAGYTVVVSNAFGDQLQRDDCVVTRQQDRTIAAPINTAASATNQTLLSLSCDAAVASATKPGNSLASPAGAAAAAAAKASATATPTPAPSPDHH